jgi:hypothetical protein
VKLIDFGFFKYASPDGLWKTLRVSVFSAPLRRKFTAFIRGIRATPSGTPSPKLATPRELFARIDLHSAAVFF